MFPRRCKKCRCYVAPQLHRCPRCNKIAPAIAVITKPTKEEKQAERTKRDRKVPIAHAKNIHWIPSAFALSANRSMVDELKRRLDKADTPALRNTIRSELRATKAQLARASVPDGKKAWTSEIFHAKTSCVSVFISPTKKRYVLAGRDDTADLIIVSRKKHARAMPFIRLALFERSPYARMLKKEKQDDATHTKRRKVKKEQRAKRRARKTAK